jgi:hypothetical protein
MRPKSMWPCRPQPLTLFLAQASVSRELSVNYLYSLYDALVSINVPSDKARAVVDAMERDMSTTLATKQDLLPLATREDLLATKQDILLLATREDLLATKQDLGMLRRDMENRFALAEQQLRSEVSRLDQRIDTLGGQLERKIDALDLRMTVKLGSMLFIGFGLVIAALRVWA